MYHTVVIGGGCLGAATAISLQRKLNKEGKGEKVCLVDKAVLCAAESSRHSGIVRSANADPDASIMASLSTKMWKNLEEYWGKNMEIDAFGAIWIAKKNSDGENPAWNQLSDRMKEINLTFEEISPDSALEKCGDTLLIDKDESYFYEPEAFQLDPSILRSVLYDAIDENRVELFEKTEVEAIITNGNKIVSCMTNNGKFDAKNFVNATGAWSSQLFSKIGLKIPVTIEPVSVVNWMESPRQIKYEYPIIADYTNLCYFRSWRGNKMHAHQPRKRSVYEIAKNFLNDLCAVNGGEYLNEPMNQSLAYNQIKNYEDISKKRFSNIDKTVYASGYRSFFDITPDLRFILGKDSKINNLFHNLGSGQAMKYSPVLGESVAEEILGEKNITKTFDYDKFKIDRFGDDYMQNFWNLVNGEENTLHRQGKNTL
ncbi:MAG: NAD(P)/FAD-dependent oxidoreductase [Alphaproteobacteria bacterium]|tara:strand:+ start:1034 stop:2314 length:1281 start_codon:yes stop_codon:yes gene_type:complete